MQWTQRNRTKGEFSFRSVGNYRQSFSSKSQLSFPTESGFSGRTHQTVGDPFPSVEKGKYK
uniref:Ribosomal protein L32 n=1 Tax=Romanomermis culicivorax TaxID=13658 RepID=A0A915K551_ROMCU